MRLSFGDRQTPAFSVVNDAFKHHVLTSPATVAVEHLGESITYHELDAQSTLLASQLELMGVIPGSRVCLLAQRSISMVIGIMAILKGAKSRVATWLCSNIISIQPAAHMFLSTVTLLHSPHWNLW